jgi:hypothetical protein
VNVRIRMSDQAVRAAVTALAFCLAGDEIFVDEDGHTDEAQTRAAQELLDRLACRAWYDITEFYGGGVKS